MVPRKPNLTTPQGVLDPDQQQAIAKANNSAAPSAAPPPPTAISGAPVSTTYTQFNLPEGMTEGEALQIVANELLNLLVRCRDVIYQTSPADSPLMKDLNAILQKYGRA